jgi:2-dehydro-3-deoxyphosphogluconate aldolase/(4S)-4-hydroxy-2-oxoglutarate aldolase
MKQNGIRQTLAKHPIIPVAKINAVEDVIPCIDNLISKGINCIEITLRTHCAIEAIKHAKKHYGKEFSVGVGTVTNKQQLAAVIAAKVDFIVLPGFFSDLKEDLESSGIPFIPGVMTASEIMKASSYGWDTFKLFPANLVGGIKGVQTFSSVFPHVKFCPTGGITKDNYKDYLEEASVISVGGSWIMK